MNKTSYGEYDALYDIYTKEFGKIRGRAQSVKKEGAKLKGHLEPLSMVRVTFVLGKRGERLTHATMTRFWEGMRQNPEKLFAALRIAALMNERSFPGQKDAALWELLLESMLLLDEREFSEEVFRRFADRFAPFLGLHL
ncbi:MAG: DNA repair protein RecO [Candidatus Sungbacteria bacterium]|nr:DNA repair protein RecO [Candidatus Sungbacteria bacterium]